MQDSWLEIPRNIAVAETTAAHKNRAIEWTPWRTATVHCRNDSIITTFGYLRLGKYFPNRKCWFFCYDKVGAQASANLFSLAMTCRANDVDRFEYFSYVFEHLPMATTMEALEALLPWNVKPILEERRKQREAALHSAAAS